MRKNVYPASYSQGQKVGFVNIPDFVFVRHILVFAFSNVALLDVGLKFLKIYYRNWHGLQIRASIGVSRRSLFIDGVTSSRPVNSFKSAPAVEFI